MTCGRSPRAAPAFRPPLGPQPGVAFTSVPLLHGDLAGRFNFKPPCLALGAMAAGRLLLIVRIVIYYFIIEVIKCSSGCSFILGTHTNGLVRRHCRALKHRARHGFPLVWGPCARCNSNGRTPHTPTSGTACRATAVSSYDLFFFNVFFADVPSPALPVGSEDRAQGPGALWRFLRGALSCLTCPIPWGARS